jgi:putative peptidoglycan lipid II flippase
VSLFKAASTVSALTLASRITGLLRDLLMAAFFGASALTDAFNVAFRIPNLFRRLFGEGAFSQAFVPALAHTREQRGEEATRGLIDHVATVLAWVLLATCIVGVLAAPLLVWAMASGLQQDARAYEAGVLMTRWMFPYIGFMSLVALSAGILNTWKRFAVPAATPVLLNACMILAAWLGAPWFRSRGIEPIYAMAAGVMAGGVLQLAVQVPALRRLGLMPRIGLTWSRLRAAWADPGVRQIVGMMGPALLGVSVAQISLLINTQIASHLPTGSVTWLFYADRLMEFPTAMLGVALGVVLMPQLASAQPLVATLFHYGAFRDADVLQVSIALAGYGVGLIGLVGIKVLAPGYYASQDMRTPVRIAVAVLVLTQLMNLAFVPLFRHAGLALSIGVGALLNAGWLLVGLHRRGSWKPSPGWWRFLLQVVAATALLTVFLLWAANSFSWTGLRAEPLLRGGLLAAMLLGAAGIYFAALWAAGLKPRQFVTR